MGHKIDGRVTAVGRPMTFKAGARIIHVGHEYVGTFMLECGFVKFSLPDWDGRDVFLSVCGPGTAIGEMAIFNDNRYPFTATAMTDVKAWYISAQDYVSLYQAEQEIRGRTTRHIFGRLLQMNRRMVHLAAETVEGRLARFFIDMAEAYGKRDEKAKTVVIPFHLSRRELCHVVNTTTETATRIMTKWHSSGALLTKKESFVLNEAFLNKSSPYPVHRETPLVS